MTTTDADARFVDTHAKQIHDANIVAVMLTHGVHRPVAYDQMDG